MCSAALGRVLHVDRHDDTLAGVLAFRPVRLGLLS